MLYRTENYENVRLQFLRKHLDTTSESYGKMFIQRASPTYFFLFMLYIPSPSVRMIE